MKLNRTPSLHDRNWRNNENANWQNIERNIENAHKTFSVLEDFLDGFDGTQLIQKNYNLFNKNHVTKGSLDQSTGEVIDTPGTFHVSDFIPVEPGKLTHIKPNQGVTVIYDSEFNYITNIEAYEHPFRVPSNGRYLRNVMSETSIEGKYIYQGEDGDLPYIEYGYSYMPEFLDLIRDIAEEVAKDHIPELPEMPDIPNVNEYVNLFDKSRVTKGSLDQNTGEIIETTGTFHVSHFVEVNPGSYLQIHPNQGVTVMYDSRQNYVGSIGAWEHPKLIPDGVKYIRNVMSESSINGKYIYLGEDFMGYYPYNQGPGANGTEVDDSEPMKILIIGNSYSVDTFTHLHDICVSAGVNVIVGVAHDSGGSLSDAMGKIRNNETIHSYYKWTNQTGYVRTASPLIDYAIEDEDWDIVLFQQMSFDSLDYNTFQPHLNDLKAHVKANISNPNVRFGINAIWSRATTSSSVGDEATQIEQFNTIVENYRTAMIDSDLEILIPTGTAIQNGRGNEFLSQVGTELTRDGSHLDEPVGRYIAAMTVFCTLFGESAFGDVSFKTDDTNGYLIYLAKMVAKKAVDNPYKISEL